MPNGKGQEKTKQKQQKKICKSLLQFYNLNIILIYSFVTFSHLHDTANRLILFWRWHAKCWNNNLMFYRCTFNVFIKITALTISYHFSIHHSKLLLVSKHPQKVISSPSSISAGRSIRRAPVCAGISKYTLKGQFAEYLWLTCDCWCSH